MYTVLANPTHHIHHKSVHSPAGLKGSMACDSAVNTYSLTGPAAAFLPACAHKWHTDVVLACTHKWHTDEVRDCA